MDCAMASAADPLHVARSPYGGRRELVGIAARLSDLAQQLQRAATATDDDASLSKSGADHHALHLHCSALSTARHAYWLRRQRTQIFGSGELFGEPAWDILLDLYIAYAEGKHVSVSSACIGSASPATTGLRWLTVLTEQGLIAREADEQDHRRIMVRLTDHGIAAMERFLTLAQSNAL
jgi:hypothetical protein